VVVPEGVVAEGVPAIPMELSRRFYRYRFTPGAAFAGWFAGRREMILQTGSRMGQTSQVFCVVYPGAPWHQLTFARERSVGAQPRPGRNQLLFLQDEGGDEQFQVILFETPTRRSWRLSDGKARHHGPKWSRDGKRLSWSSNARNGKDLDVYVVEPDTTGPARRLTTASGLDIAADFAPDGKTLAVVRATPRLGSRVVLVDVANGQERRIEADAAGVGGVKWAADGRSIFWLMAARDGRIRLARHDLETGRTLPVGESIAWDIDDYDLADDGKTVALVANEDGLSRLHVLDVTGHGELPAPNLPAGQISGLAFRDGSRELAFNLETARSPCHVYSYIVDRRQLVRWTLGEPAGLRFGAAEPELVRFPSFDGRMIPAFVYKPPAGTHKPPYPVLIDIHGGPRAQFRPGFLGPANFELNELGIAIVYPNVRGSSGYGLEYLALDDGLHREDAVKDVGALLDWIKAQPDLDAGRVAVTGGSYGGYMALAALTRYGDRLKAGVDFCGISDFLTFLRDAPDLTRDWQRAEFGDERVPRVASFLKSISPLTNAAKIKAPLLVLQGRNDPRVPVGEAEQIVAAARKNDVPVWYILAQDEGHGFSRLKNREYAQYVQYLFLSRYLLPQAAGPGR
jgi:dipeptidyl aminopeptidase/acylaminoacyl peptidase